jgi:hypothetical protein
VKTFVIFFATISTTTGNGPQFKSSIGIKQFRQYISTIENFFREGQYNGYINGTAGRHHFDPIAYYPLAAHHQNCSSRKVLGLLSDLLRAARVWNADHLSFELQAVAFHILMGRAYLLGYACHCNERIYTGILNKYNR